MGANYKKILRLSYDVIITYDLTIIVSQTCDNVKMLLITKTSYKMFLQKHLIRCFCN